MHRSSHVFSLIAALCSACATTTGRATTDAAPDALAPDALAPDAPGDVTLDAPDAPSGPCRWRAGEGVLLTSGEALRTIVDLKASQGGAWLLSSDDAGGNRDLDLTLERLDGSGHRLSGSPIWLLPGAGAGAFSLAVDDILNRRGVLQELPRGAQPTCLLVPLDGAGRAAARAGITLPTGGFSLDGCRDLLVNTVGYTFTAVQVRALWGVSMVQLNPAGGVTTQLPPSLIDEYPEVDYRRFGGANRGFVMALSRRVAAGGSGFHVRRFDEDGAPQAPEQHLRNAALAIGDFTVVGTPAGLLALWAETSGPSGSQPVLTLRTLDADGSPRAEPRVVTELGFYQGGLSATFAQGDVLATAITGSGVLRAVVAVLSADGGQRGELIALPQPSGSVRVDAVRIVTTTSGALAVFTADPGSYPNRMVAVPLYCER